MTRYLISCVGLLVVVITLSSGAHAQDIGQTSFVVPKPKLTILKAVKDGTIENILLETGLDKKLENEFPSNNTSVPREVVVQIFVKVLGIPVRVVPITVIRGVNQTWNDALGGRPVTFLISSVTFTWDDGRVCANQPTAFAELFCAIDNGYECACGTPNGDYNCAKPGRRGKDLY